MITCRQRRRQKASPAMSSCDLAAVWLRAGRCMILHAHSFAGGIRMSSGSFWADSFSSRAERGEPGDDCSAPDSTSSLCPHRSPPCHCSPSLASPDSTEHESPVAASAASLLWPLAKLLTAVRPLQSCPAVRMFGAGRLRIRDIGWRCRSGGSRCLVAPRDERGNAPQG